MLYPLDTPDYARVAPITDALPHYLSAQAVIAGASPGRVWVDDPAHPRCALIDAPEGWHLLGETVDEGFGRAVGAFYGGDVLPAARLSRWRYSCLHCHPAAWHTTIAPLLSAFAPTWDYQHFLRHRGPCPDWRSLVPAGYELVRVDESFLRSGVEGAEDFTGHGFWSVADFLERGFGFCVVYENRAVGSCTADCVVGDRAEVGVRTLPEHRRRGLATAVTAAAVEHCLARGITHIGWHCWSGNVASLRTAQRAGFVEVLDHYGFEVEFE